VDRALSRRICLLACRRRPANAWIASRDRCRRRAPGVAGGRHASGGAWRGECTAVIPGSGFVGRVGAAHQLQRQSIHWLSPHLPWCSQRPNYSFKRTAATGCATIMRRSQRRFTHAFGMTGAPPARH
jgi:hypothetical protein